MVFAMHQIQLLTIVRHLERDSWFESYLNRQVAEGRLIASVTSEVGTGGDMARSIAAVTPAEKGLGSFEKQAPTVSYGAYADDLLTTLRRAPESEPGDQVAALTRKDQHSLEPTGTWDVLGMRGTCSPGYVGRAPSSRPSRCWPSRLPRSPPSRWSRSPTSCGHTCGSGSPRTRSTDRGPSSRPRPSATPGATPPAAQRLSRLSSEVALLRGR